MRECPANGCGRLEGRPYASCMELEVRPASEVERFVAFALANGCQCRRWAAGHRVTFDVPFARDPTEARRIALDLIARFSAENHTQTCTSPDTTDPVGFADTGGET